MSNRPITKTCNCKTGFNSMARLQNEFHVICSLQRTQSNNILSHAVNKWYISDMSVLFRGQRCC
jgi:hypothetical protein